MKIPNFIAMASVSVTLALALPAWSATESPVSTALPDTQSVSASAFASGSDTLLPGIMSPMEKVMWGRHGLARSVTGWDLTEESREKEMGLRRTMLTVHEISGLTTLAFMIATVVYGQLALNEYRTPAPGSESNSRYGDIHSTLVGFTIFTYATTATLALLTPPPSIRRHEWSTVSTHKALAWVHVTGMIVTPILAGYIRDSREALRFHQISGYVTTAAFAGAVVAVTF